MRIAIDISQVIYGTGASVYTKKLVENLLGQDKINDYLLFGGSARRLVELKIFTASLQGKFKTRLLPIPPSLADLVWNRLHILPIDYLIGKVDVFHSSDWTQPPSNAFKVTTVHDLAPLRFPKLTHPRIVSVHKRRLKWVRKEVDRVIVPSLATKNELLDLVKISAKKIVVIPEGVDLIFKRKSSKIINRMKNHYKMFGDYLLTIGMGGRKNTENLIHAFERVRPGKGLKLVILGRPVAEIKRQFSQKRGIRFLGHVPDGELPIFYSGAQALVFPSLYEGFGLPILQAFACGCPVVTSNTSSLTEVAGKAAVLVNPHDVSSIAKGIRKALDQKQELVKKGLVRAKKFTWEKAARETIRVYSQTKA